MTNFTYPQNQSPAGDMSALFVFTDPACDLPAPITDMSGLPLTGGHVNLGADGQWPLFQCTVSPLYTPAADGTITTLYPALDYSNPVAVSGSRGGNVALGSLITTLVNAGVPIVDNTVA